MKLGFTMFLSVYGSLLNLRCVWNTGIRLLNAVLPNLRKPHCTRLTPMGLPISFNIVHINKDKGRRTDTKYPFQREQKVPVQS